MRKQARPAFKVQYRKPSNPNKSVSYNTSEEGYNSRSKSPNNRSTGSVEKHFINVSSTQHIALVKLNTNSQEELSKEPIFAVSRPYNSSKSKDVTTRSIHGELA